MLSLSRYSFGVGDRFAHQARAQLRAFVLASEQNIDLVPVWNKSNREHTFIGTEPSSVLHAAQKAVKELDWKKPWHIDADHINLDTVERFLAPSDFFTIDVAHFIGQPAAPADLDAFVSRHPELGKPESVRMTANKYLAAVKAAGEIYRHIASRKGEGNFITEVSMDETDAPQTPGELLVILAAIADEKIPIQTIAPKFTGRFNKGVDYVGDIAQFTKEFEDDLAAIAQAIREYGLPENLKLSVHSGSDKFSIYAPIRNALRKTGAGIHLKTAGTTWLEELIGLAEAGGSGLELAKEIYREAYGHAEELCAPYASVIDIDYAKLPKPETVAKWTSEQFTGAMRHDQSNPLYDKGVRQLLHVGFKIAAKMGNRYLNMLDECEESIARNVTLNIYDRHIKPLFIG
ncbi:MAG TPA: tagaturonate epimerase family protein [Bryobacteraceae bacterium]|nr:tagaturonate epimerase family protein [Bryobacteraceae bacterium]